MLLSFRYRAGQALVGLYSNIRIGLFKYENSRPIRILMALFEYLKLFGYYQKLLIIYPSHCLIQFSIVQDKIVPHFQLILHASRHVCKICYTQ